MENSPCMSKPGPGSFRFVIGEKLASMTGRRGKCQKKKKREMKGRIPDSYLNMTRTLVFHKFAPASASFSFMGTKAGAFQRRVLFVMTISVLKSETSENRTNWAKVSILGVLKPSFS